MSNGRHMIFNSRVEDILPALDPESYDACLCDPPYGLKFMGKHWDHGVPSAEIWKEVYRVLKPGAFLMAFGGTRTFHRLTCAIEDAGFEVRDCLMWLHGQGFPKSLDISKAIDKERCEDKEPTRVICRYIRSHMESIGIGPNELSKIFNCTASLITHWAAKDTYSQPSLPTPDQWEVLKKVLKMTDTDMDKEFYRLSARKGTVGDSWNNRPVEGERRQRANTLNSDIRMNSSRGETEVITSSSDKSISWEGYGTALKPAWEPIILAMKPCSGTFAQNALEHGVAGLNIDSGRIKGESVHTSRNIALGSSSGGIYQPADKPAIFESHPAGRWPANLILSHTPWCVEIGTRKVRSGNSLATESTKSTIKGGLGGKISRHYADEDGLETIPTFDCHPLCPIRLLDEQSGEHGDSGGASRFFYTAKVSTAERNLGGIDCKHPTLKPIPLARYLATLLLPPSRDPSPRSPRSILVPFSGAGSEVIGCLAAGWDVVDGIELEPEYAQWAEARIAAILPYLDKIEKLPRTASAQSPTPQAIRMPKSVDVDGLNSLLFHPTPKDADESEDT